MLKTLYEFEKENKMIYDDVRDYCRAERINEEYFRASAVQKKLRHKLVDIILNILHFGKKEKGYEKTNSEYPSLLKNTYSIHFNKRYKNVYKKIR